MDFDILTAHMLDIARECRDNYALTSSAFLDLAEQSAVSSALDKVGEKYTFFGGYDDAERRICVFSPDYISDVFEYYSEYPDDCPIEILRCSYKKGAIAPTHRDYLGSILSLGVKRENIGDILVYNGGADIIILKRTADFFRLEYKNAGRTPLEIKIVPLSNISLPNVEIYSERITVASPRLDCIIAEIFSLSREKASEAVKSGMIFVNSTKIQKTDMHISQGAKIVLRGKGKAVVKEICGETRRGRLAIMIDRFK